MTDEAAALLALWNDVDAELDAQYNDWHAHEHVPERLTVPGILWGRRYGRAAAGGSPRYLTLYGLRAAGVLDSEPYQRLLREPTPMSRQMRPALSNVSRWVCTLYEQAGLDRGRHLAVWTSPLDHPDADSAAAGLVDGPGALGRLIAKRLLQASPLPWLQAGQGHAIEGRWLVCMPFEGNLEAGGSGPAGGSVYARLPVGRSAS